MCDRGHLGVLDEGIAGRPLLYIGWFSSHDINRSGTIICQGALFGLGFRVLGLRLAPGALRTCVN